MTDHDFPAGDPDERELYLRWLRFLRGAVVRKASGLDDAAARWRPNNALLSLIGIVNHLTHVEWRWIDGEMRGEATHHSRTEFDPGPEPTIAEAIAAYRDRATAMDRFVRAAQLETPCRAGDGRDLRWVLLHLINETARHAGHADATRELFDGQVGE